jgi:hypothetical protein
MSNKVNLLIDTVPYVPDIFNNSPSLYQCELTSNENSIPTHQTMFIFSLNIKDGLANELNKYNNPYYMLYGIDEPQFFYSLPSIKYFSATKPLPVPPFYFSNSTLIKEIYKSYVFTPEIIEILSNIGYDTTPTSPSDITPSKLFPPSIFPTPPINSTMYDNKILFQKLLIFDAVSGRNDEIIFIYFYQNYITENPIHLNNYYINNTSQIPFLSSVFYNKKNWNVFIYPYTSIIQRQDPNPEYYIPVVNNINLNNVIQNPNFVESLNFNNKDYCPYIDKIEYKYFENKNFVQTDNKLNTAMTHSKNLISFSSYYSTKISKSNNNIFINLNEINKSNNLTNLSNSVSENTNLKFLTKSKSYSNVNKYYSMSADNKMGYINNKLNPTDLTYAPYYNNENRTQTMYPITKNFFINTYINILNDNPSIFPTGSNVNYLLQSTNWYIRKILLQINPLIINNTNAVELMIYPLIECKNLLEITNNIQVKFVSIGNLATTNNYYIDRFRLVVKWSELVNNTTINFVYYIILNIAYYNQNKLNISNITKTTNMDDLGYINFTNIERSNTLVPTIFNKLENSNIYTNMIDYNMIDIKYYSFSLNYNLLSSNPTQNNLIFINHFYCLIPYIKPTIDYTYEIDNTTNTILISNIFNLLEKKINNFITNSIFLSDNFYSIKYNNYNSESIFKLSVAFDSNILKDSSHQNPNTDYIDYLSYIKHDFGPSVLPYVQPNNFSINYPNSSIMIPTGNYIILKYHNNFISRNSAGVITEMSDIIVNEILNNSVSVCTIQLYNYALLIKLDDDFNPDDTFFVNNIAMYTSENQYMYNQGNYQTKMYLVPCNTDYSLYYYGTRPFGTTSEQISSEQHTPKYLVGLELFNYYNGIINSTNLFPGNKIFINLVINKYMNFFELNFAIDAFDIMKQNNKLCFDKNNLLFKIHNNNQIQQIVKYDSLRFNSGISQGINYWDSELIIKLANNKNLINYMKVLDNNLLFILNCNKIINLLKRCIFYLRIIKNTIYFESIKHNKPHCIEEEICKFEHHKKWKNHTLEINDCINIINYLATCCININKVCQIINVTFCYEISDVDSILLNLVYVSNTVTIQTINDYILQLEKGMEFYANRIILVQNEVFSLFTEFEKGYNLNSSPISNYPEYKKQYIEILKEIYLNDIILYAINLDVLNIFNSIKIHPNINPELFDFLTHNLTEIIDIIENYKLNINILLETLNFVRLFYDDHLVYGLYPPLNDTIIKTNYIYNTEYYNNIYGNNLPTMNIFTYFPPNPPNPPLSTLSDEVRALIIKLVKMLSDTYKVNYTALLPLFGYNIYTKPYFKKFVKTLKKLILKSNILFNLPDTVYPGNTNMKTYIYSWDIIQKFISNCLEVKLFIKCMFYLNKIKKHIHHNNLLSSLTDINNYIYSIENIYSTIQKITTQNIISDPESVIAQYQIISNLLLEQISVSNTTIYPSTYNYIFTPYNQYSIMVIFLKGLYDLKITLLAQLNIGIFDNVFKYFNLGYQGEDIIPFNDYNLLIDQRSTLYTIFPSTNNLYLPTANMHTFNSNLFVLQLIQIFNTNKRVVNNYYISLDNDNSTNKYSLIFNALNYGYIHTDYVFINIDNVNT